MKRIIVLSMFLLLVINTNAQTQQGYVKTKGRLGNNGSVIKGMRLSGVTITPKGQNSVLSGNNGTFTLTLSSNNYFIQEVKKQGYVLSDPDMLFHQYEQSKNPLAIVMEDKAQQAADKRAIERKISHNLYSQLQQRSDELETLKEQQKITEEKYRELLQKLNQDQDDNEKIIKDMAERYSKIDFDEINEMDYHISQLILEGKLTEAESLINTKGDIDSRIQELDKYHNANVQTRTELEQSELMEQRVREGIAQDCYRIYEISKMRHLNDTAAYYIEKRTSLDTTNVEWHLDAGQFLLEVLANYDKAHDHYMRALSLVSNSGNDYATAKVYILIGKLYYQLGNYNNALSYYNKAIEIIPENDTSELHDEMLSTAYQYIATTYRECRKYSESINYYEKAKELIIRTYGEDSQEMAYYYSDIAILYSSMKDHEHGLEYDLKAMALFEKHKSEDNPDLASIYNSIGVQYNGCGNMDKAKLYLEKALAIKRQTLGDKHPSLATVYNNLAMMYINYNELDHAQEYFNKAARIWKTVYGEDSYRLIVLYGNIASMYESANKEEEAIKYYEMALHIAIHHYGTDDPITEEVLPSYYLALTTLAEQSPTEENKKRLEDFMADKITTCMVIDGGPASQLGLSGKCYVLEYCGWNIEDGNCMFHLVAPTAGKPKDLVLMSNNKIHPYHFEDKIGVQWLLTFIDKDKKKEIIRRYKDRKSWDN